MSDRARELAEQIVETVTANLIAHEAVYAAPKSVEEVAALLAPHLGGQWVRVNERLPDNEEETVWIGWAGLPLVYDAEWVGLPNGGGEWHCDDDTWAINAADAPTHWQPHLIPSPPSPEEAE